MTESPVILGVDIGTTSCKVVAADGEANLLGIGSATYPVHTPHAGWAEQSMSDVWEGMVRAVREALTAGDINPAHVRALSFSGTLHSLLLIDAQGQPLTHALIWADTRAAMQAQQIRTRADASALYGRTGCPAQPTYPLAKLLWLRQSQPDVFDAAHKFLSIRDYVIYRLTGRIVTGYSLASGTGLMDIDRLVWDAEALGLAQITPQRLPDLLPSETQITGLLPQAAEALGLPTDVTLVLGGSDGALANLGAGAIAPGCAALTIGASGAIRLVGPRRLTHPREHTWCYLVPGGAYLVGGAINNGGIVLNWFHDTFTQVEGEQAAAAALPPGAEGLIFLPFLAGERCPNWNADARGALFGLSLRHERAHFVRAIMEGVAFRMYSIFCALAELDPITEIRASGGFIRSPLWLQIVADVFGRPILLPDTQEMSGMGAVFVGMYALGMVDDLIETTRYVGVELGATPNMDNHAAYQELFGQFQTIYDHLTPDFAALADFRRAHGGEP